MTIEDQAIITAYQCPECEFLHEEEPDEDPRYECGNCGNEFSRSESEYESHRCDQCGKFAGKLAKTTCPECQEGVDEWEEVEAVYDEGGELVSRAEAEKGPAAKPQPLNALLAEHKDDWFLWSAGGGKAQPVSEVLAMTDWTGYDQKVALKDEGWVHQVHGKRTQKEPAFRLLSARRGRETERARLASSIRLLQEQIGRTERDLASSKHEEFARKHSVAGRRLKELQTDLAHAQEAYSAFASEEAR